MGVFEELAFGYQFRQCFGKVTSEDLVQSQFQTIPDNIIASQIPIYPSVTELQTQLLGPSRLETKLFPPTLILISDFSLPSAKSFVKHPHLLPFNHSVT